MSPKFKEGECVILQSISRPELNGEYTVREAVSWGETYKCRLTEMTVKRIPTNKVAYGYTLEEVVSTEVKGDITYEHTWSETALRKKHEPSQQSFKDLMTTLKSPQKVEWD